MKRILIAVAAASALVLTGCGGVEASVKQPVPPASQPAEVDADEVDGDEPSQTEPEAEEPTVTEDGVAKFGETYVWDSGLEVTVSVPKKYKPSKYAGSQQFKNHIVSTITLMNGTDELFEPALFTVSAQSGESAADRIFDSAKGIELPPSTKLRPGKSVKFKVAFGVEDPKDIVFEVSPDFLHDAVMYES